MAGDEIAESQQSQPGMQKSLKSSATIIPRFMLGIQTTVLMTQRSAV